MRISDWSSDVCSSDLTEFGHLLLQLRQAFGLAGNRLQVAAGDPDTVAVAAAYPAVVALGLKQLDLLSGTEGADDAVALGWADAHIGISEERRVGKGGLSPCSIGG